MQENEFERKVQQKMDGLRVRPSGAVWENVEHELRKKKKRRVVFYIFLLAGLSLLGYSGYFLFNQPKQNIVDQTSTSSLNKQGTGPLREEEKTSNPVIPQNEKNVAVHPDELSQEPARKDIANDADKKLNAVDNKHQTKKVNDNILKVPVAGNSGRHHEKTGVVVSKATQDLNRKEPVEAVDPRNDATNEAGIAKNENVVGKPAVNSKIGQPGMPSLQVDEQARVVLPQDSLLDKNEKPTAGIKTDTATVANNENAIVQLSPQNKKPGKLKWGFEFSAGVSDVERSALPFKSGQQRMYDYFSPLPITPGNAAYFPPVAPSPIEPGFGFKLGPVVEMELSKRSTLSAGLHYARMSTKMKVGTYTNTSVVVNNAASQSLRLSAAYSGFHQKDYTSHYHFIQLPVAFHLQLNKGKKLPVSWVAGASAGYLVNTNMLLYDTAAGGIYYRDKKAFNRFQFNLHSGFALRFGNGKAVQWSVGPEVSLGMNKLVKDTYTKKQYMLYGGLTGRLIFSKKK